MPKSTNQQKLKRLEAQITLLKRSLTEKPDPSIDERNWKKIRSAVKQARRRTFRKLYGGI